MAGTYTKLYYHIVFSTKNRAGFITHSIEEELYKYICGIIRGIGGHCFEINGTSDHVHLLTILPPKIAISDVLRDIKANSSRFIKEEGWVPGRFSWQEGFGAFSYSRSQLDAVIRYIKDQQKHHARKSFLEEYTALLDRFGVKYDQRYVFKPVEE